METACERVTQAAPNLSDTGPCGCPCGAEGGAAWRGPCSPRVESWEEAAASSLHGEQGGACKASGGLATHPTPPLLVPGKS